LAIHFQQPFLFLTQGSIRKQNEKKYSWIELEYDVKDTEKKIAHEIDHGKYLSETGLAGKVWNWETPAGKIRWQRRVQMISQWLHDGDEVLELGCGTGYFTQELVARKIHLTAIDISPELIAEAQKRVRSASVDFAVQNAFQMTFENERFDAVVGSSVLHHLEIEKAVIEIFRVLKPTGKMIFTEPNMMNPQIALQKNIPWLKRKAGDSPDETAFFRWKLKSLLRNAGFKVISIVPFDFLHPAVPLRLIKPVRHFGNILEKMPLVKEIAGSLYIMAEK